MYFSCLPAYDEQQNFMRRGPVPGMAGRELLPDNAEVAFRGEERGRAEAGGALPDIGDGAAVDMMGPAVAEMAPASGMKQKPVAKPRTNFVETWLWMDVTIGYVLWYW